MNQRYETDQNADNLGRHSSELGGAVGEPLSAHHRTLQHIDALLAGALDLAESVKNGRELEASGLLEAIVEARIIALRLAEPSE